MKKFFLLVAATGLVGACSGTSSYDDYNYDPPPAVVEDTPSSTPTPTHTSELNIVHPGAYCTPAGARGETNRGTLMKCSRKPGDVHARWRKA